MDSHEEGKNARDTIIKHIVGKTNYYDILNVPNDASEFEIKKAFRALAIVLHPDKNPESEHERAGEAFKAVNGAYAVLSDSEKRANYDQEQIALKLQRERQERERKRQEEELARANSLQSEAGLSRSEFWILVGAAIGIAGLAALCYFSSSSSDQNEQSSTNNSSTNKSKRSCNTSRAHPK